MLKKAESSFSKSVSIVVSTIACVGIEVPITVRSLHELSLVIDVTANDFLSPCMLFVLVLFLAVVAPSADSFKVLSGVQSYWQGIET
jgi:hypothetical protein